MTQRPHTGPHTTNVAIYTAYLTEFEAFRRYRYDLTIRLMLAVAGLFGVAVFATGIIGTLWITQSALATMILFGLAWWKMTAAARAHMSVKLRVLFAIEADLDAHEYTTILPVTMEKQELRDSNKKAAHDFRIIEIVVPLFITVLSSLLLVASFNPNFQSLLLPAAP